MSTRKLLWVLPIAFLCLTITACVSNAGMRSGSTSHATRKTFSAAILYYDYDDAYVSSVRNALTQDLAAKGIAYQEYDAGNDQATQNKQVDKAIEAGAGVLVVNIVSSGNSEKADVICQKANAAGIPVVFFNRPVEEQGYEGVILGYYDNVAFVGTDPAEAGHLQGQLIGTYLVDHFDEVDLNGNGTISYALFKGEAANVEAIYRTKYAVEDANKILMKAGYPCLAYFDESSIDTFQLDLTGSWSAESARDYMTTDLLHYNAENNTMIELVICNSDTMAEGAISALQSFGYNLGTSDCTTIPVFGVDASTTGKKLIAQGMMTGTISQDAEGMAHCMSLLVSNVKAQRDLLSGTEAYATDEKNKLAQKLYIPYSIYEPAADDVLD